MNEECLEQAQAESAGVRAPSSLVRERERERKKERDREREREREKEIEIERGREIMQYTQ